MSGCVRKSIVDASVQAARQRLSSFLDRFAALCRGQIAIYESNVVARPLLLP
jgi:hypothetical protein